MAYQYQQVWARIPESLYQDFCNYVNKTGQKKTQAIVYAIAKYIRSNQMKTTTELEDIKIDLQDIEGFLENLDKRLTQIESKLTQEDGLSDHDKSLITRFTQDCLEDGLSFTVKDILLLLSQDQNDNSLQRKIACYLRRQGWYKVRRTVDDKKQYVWVRDNE